MVLTLLIPYLQFSVADSQHYADSYKNIKVIGHRGAAASAPENTLSSFEFALQTHADMLELDVHLSKDDSLIIMHDRKVDRTTNGKGEIRNLLYDEISKLDAGAWFDTKFTGEKAPTLSEVFDLVQGRKTILIELKWPKNGIYKNLVAKVVEMIRKYNAENWTIIQSFEPLYLEELQRIAPDIIAHQLVFGFSSWLPVYFDRSIHFGRFKYSPAVNSINCFYMYANKQILEKYHKRNLTVYVFTIDKPDQILKAANMGVDGIITNNPELAFKTLNQ